MAYSFVQAVYGFAFPLAIAPSGAANLLVVHIGWSDAADTNPTIADSESSTYVSAATKVTDALNYSHQAFYVSSTAAGIDEIAATWSNGTPGSIDMWVSEWSGLDTASPLITVATAVQASPGTAANACTSGAVAVSEAPALILGWHSNESNSPGTTTFTAGTGFTSRLTSFGIIQDRRITSTGSHASTATPSNDPAGVGSIMLAFRELVAAKAPPPPRRPNLAHYFSL